MEPTLQTTHYTMEDALTEPMRSPLQTMPHTHRERAMELSQPIPEMSTGTPQVAESLSPAASASHVSQVPMGLAHPPALDPCVTTLMVRSIPPKVSQEDLIALWPPTWGYNFLYLPHSPKQRRSVAYAFVNFVSNEAAKLFYNSWEGQVFTARGHTKALSIHAAQIQGVWSNLKHLQKQGIGQLKNDKHLPAFFDGDVCISFRGVLREMEIMEECSTAT